MLEKRYKSACYEVTKYILRYWIKQASVLHLKRDEETEKWIKAWNGVDLKCL